MADNADLKDFSKKRERIEFKINGVVLRAKPAIGLTTAQRVVDMRDKMNATTGGEKLALLDELFVALLHSASHADIRAVLADEDDPVDPEQLSDMINYVMEKQGLRPTVPSSESSESSSNGELGTRGEGGASHEG